MDMRTVGGMTLDGILTVVEGEGGDREQRGRRTAIWTVIQWRLVLGHWNQCQGYSKDAVEPKATRGTEPDLFASTEHPASNLPDYLFVGLAGHS